MGNVIIKSGLLLDGRSKKEKDLINDYMKGKKFSVLMIIPGEAHIIVFDKEDN